MDIFAFIFARGGSKGLVKKNIKELGGLPLITHSIYMAKKIEEIKKIYVSTDCNEIADVAQSYDAEIIQRPLELAKDDAPEWLAWQHAVDYIQKKGESFDVFLSLPTTSPLRSKEDITNCIVALTPEVDAVITVTPSARNPYFNMVTREDNGLCHKLYDANVMRRQDAKPTYDITTVAYVTRPNYIMKQEHLFAGRIASVLIPKERALDIDDAYDFLIAETLYDQIRHVR